MKEVGEEKVQLQSQPSQRIFRQHRTLSLHRQHLELEPFAVIQMDFMPILLIVKNTTSVPMEHLMSTLVQQELCGMMT